MRNFVRWIAIWVASVAWPLATIATGAEPPWELDPYRARVFVAIEPDVIWSKERQSDFERDLSHRAAATMGGLGEISVTRAPDELNREVFRNSRSWDDAFGRVWEEAAAKEASDDLDKPDKIVVLRLDESGECWQSRARIWDRATRAWSVATIRKSRRGESLAASAWTAAAAVWAPHARIERVSPETILLRPRGLAIPPSDAAWRPIHEGDAYRVFRKSAPDSGDLASYQPIDGTWLVVDRPLEDGRAECKLVSRYQDPLADVSNLDLALGVPAVFSATRLRILNDESEFDDQPLAGLRIVRWPLAGGPPIELGTTDIEGGIELAASDGLSNYGFFWGNHELGRVPLLPGAAKVSELRLLLEPTLLTALDVGASLDRALVDLVAERQAYAARVRRKVSLGAFADAESLLAEARSLPSAKSFQERIDAEQKRWVDSAPDQQREISAIFSELSASAARFLDSKEWDRLAALIASKGQPEVPAATAPAAPTAESPANPAPIAESSPKPTAP